MKGIFTRSPNRKADGTSSTHASPSPLSTGYSVPPFPVPQVDGKLALHYTSRGLLIIPTHTHTLTANSRPHSTSHANGVRLAWERRPTPEVVKAVEVIRILGEETQQCTVECHGLIGIVKLYRNSYLLVITRRELAGDFLGESRTVYRCTGVLAIPLCKDSAKVVIAAEARRIQRSAPVITTNEDEGQDSDDVSQEEGSNDSDDDEVATPSIIGRSSFVTGSLLSPITDTPTTSRGSGKQSSEVKSAQHKDSQRLGDQGTIGTTSPSTVPQVKVDNQSSDSNPQLGSTIAAGEELSPDDRDANRAELEDKLVKEAARQYARGEMLFSYHFDLTTSLQHKYEHIISAGGKPATSVVFEEPRATLPLWRRAERRFFHNEYISQDFITAGLHSMVLPLMQGYFQTASLPIPAAIPEDEEVTATLTIISRRSKERPGLRYQRRGANDVGQVANFVETEQVLHVTRSKQSESHLFSFLQFRGSIPLYWSQNPFNMKPPPILEGTKEQRALACAKHFEAQIERYGPITCVNLAEQKGKEGEITESFRENVEALQSQGVKVKYQAFDFHKECAGMKFENVSKLIDILQDSLESMDCFWRTWSTSTSGQKTSTVRSTQNSMMRTNCLDCLDRTNVVQSAFGRHLLASQLSRIGLTLKPPPHEAYDAVFNELWANNGDLVAQSYAGTRALKGDFTRTGKRNFVGMFNDATASIYRMLQGAVYDFWRQTVISFIYGELSLSGLERYGDDLTTVDPSNEVRLRRVRASAIDTCVSMALHDGEVKIGGWTLFSPLESNTIRSNKLEEKIVLLTDKALYVCAYDFSIEKLAEFSRILLGDIIGLKKGPYIISPRDGQDAEQHWGLVVSYLNESKRFNSATIKNVQSSSRSGSSSPTARASGGWGKENFVALKAIALDFAGTLEREPRGKFTPQSTLDSQAGLLPRSATRTSMLLHSSYEAGELTSREIVDKIAQLLLEECSDAGACEIASPTASDQGQEGFVTQGDIQTLAQAKAQAPMLAGLIEGLRRRVWL